MFRQLLAPPALHQASFEDASCYNCKRTIRNRRLLNTLDPAIPRETMMAAPNPHYSKGERGLSPSPLETMLCVYFGNPDPACFRVL